jgi:hypothetical protein
MDCLRGFVFSIKQNLPEIMKKMLFPILVLVALFGISLMYYQNLLNDIQLKSGLMICTVIWFVGLFLKEKLIKKNDAD